MDISVILCCHNSAQLLPDTLFHLANQKGVSNMDYEIVLVNNNSTDNTVSVARDVWRELNTSIKLTIVDETAPGLANARKKGVITAASDLLVYCDDDNWLDENYLSIAHKFMIENPQVGALGGQSIGVLDGDEPHWWSVKSSGYAVGKQATKSGNVTERGYIWGAGIVIRKAIILNLYKAGFKSLLVGRSGSTLSSGDDAELSSWVILMGYELWYLEELRFKHFITRNRLTDNYVNKMFEGHTQASKKLELYNLVIRNLKSNKNMSSLGLFGKGIFQSVRGFVTNSEYAKILGQIKLGSTIKVHSAVYEILKIYSALEKNRPV